ncbi:Imm52 family immunity protein [Pyxidicoccus sp. 3LG]
MTEFFSIGTYWGVRREPAHSCAERAQTFFQSLRVRDPSFEQWYRAGRKLKGAPGIPIDMRSLQELTIRFQKGQIHTDLNRRPMEELGFGLSVWTERAGRTRISMRCGVYSPFGSNVCLMNLPDQGEIAERLLTLPMMTQLLLDMVEAWDPDSGLVDTSDHMMLNPDETSVHARVGWVTYVSKSRGTIPPLPAPVRIDPVGDKGMLITLTPERFTASNPEHVALAARVRELLDRAGLLRPPQQ